MKKDLGGAGAWSDARHMSGDFTRLLYIFTGAAYTRLG
jgi:hypothetical protein